MLTYDGVVRYGSLSAPISFNTYFSAETSNSNNAGNSSSSLSGKTHSKMSNSNLSQSNQSATGLDDDETKDTRPHSALDLSYPTSKGEDGNASFSMIIQSGNYSTALSLTIAIGCSLLILNVLVFAGIFYQRDRNRLETKLDRKKVQVCTQRTNFCNN